MDNNIRGAFEIGDALVSLDLAAILTLVWVRVALRATQGHLSLKKSLKN